MSRFSVVAVCALLAVVGLVVSGQLGAQEEGGSIGLDTPSTVSASHATVADAEERIEAALDGRLRRPLEFEEVPLSDVIAQLADEYGIPILFDNAALDEMAISADTEITIKDLYGITLRSALNLMLRQPGLEDLTSIIEEEVLLVTTEERANESLVTRAYRVDDLDCSERPDSKDKFCCSLPQVIVSCLEFDSWQRNGNGEGEIRVMKPGILVVSQTRKVHQKIEELLDDLRDVVAEIEGGSESGGF